MSSRKFKVPLGLVGLASNPASGSIGDTYFNTSNNLIHVYNGSTWTSTQGVQGTQGATGTQGNTGSQGTQGTQGLQGTTGTQGAVGSPGAMNYSQTLGTKTLVTTGASFPYTVVSTTITTNGYPVQVTVTGDAENATAGSWGRMQLYRGTTAIGNDIQFEGSGGSENSPYALTVIDTPSAGTYTYSMKIVTLSGGNFNFGENTGPVLTAVELSGATGTQGVQGIQGTTGSQGTQGVQGTTGSQGTQGIQGTTGTQGTTGSQGTTGAQGTTGTQGTQGIAGTSPSGGATVPDVLMLGGM